MSKCDDCEPRKVYAKMFDMHWLGEDDCPIYCPLEVEDGKTYTSPTYTLEQKGEVGMSKVNVHYPITDIQEER